MTVETVELSVEIRSYDAAHRIAVSFLKWLYNKRFHDVQDRLVNKILTRGYPRSVRVAVELPQKLAYRMRMRPQCATVERTPRQLGGLSISGTLRVAGLQSAGKPADPDANLDELDRVAKRIVGQADLLITPELFVTGYDIGDRLRELVSVGHLESVRSIAERNKLAIIVGLAEEGPVGALHNSAVFIDERGVVRGRHRKTHLFGEIDRAYFTPGSQPATVVQYRGVQVGVMICYDVEFPENVRMAALAGADLLAVPTAQMEPFEFVADVVVRARAWENQIYLAYINHDGAENATTYVGRSSIVGPDGGVLDRIESGTGTIIAEIDTEVVRAAQRANPYLTDVRPELNAPLVAPPAPRPAWPN